MPYGAAASAAGATDGPLDSETRGGHEVSVSAAGVAARLDATQWDIVTAEEPTRTLTDHAGRAAELTDVVVRATRRS